MKRVSGVKRGVNIYIKKSEGAMQWIYSGCTWKLLLFSWVFFLHTFSHIYAWLEGKKLCGLNNFLLDHYYWNSINTCISR